MRHELAPVAFLTRSHLASKWTSHYNVGPQDSTPDMK